MSKNYLNSIFCLISFIVGAGLTYLIMASNTDQQQDLKHFKKTIISKNHFSNLSEQSAISPLPMTILEEKSSSIGNEDPLALPMKLAEYRLYKEKISAYEDKLYSFKDQFAQPLNEADFMARENPIRQFNSKALELIKSKNNYFKTHLKIDATLSVYLFAEYFLRDNEPTIRINQFFAYEGRIRTMEWNMFAKMMPIISNELYLEIQLYPLPTYNKNGVHTLFYPVPDLSEPSYKVRTTDEKIVMDEGEKVEWAASNKNEEESFFKYLKEKYKNSYEP